MAYDDQASSRSGRCTLIQTLTKNRVLPALCGVLEAMISVIYLMMQHTDGPVIFHSLERHGCVAGKPALAAGACAIAAGIWRSASGTCWPVVLNGLALGALGLIQYGLAR